MVSYSIILLTKNQASDGFVEHKNGREGEPVLRERGGWRGDKREERRGEGGRERGREVGGEMTEGGRREG